MFQAEKKYTLKDKALTQIRTAIANGWLKPGDRVNEAKIASEMGMSRFPVREAITCLQGEGLMVAVPFKGTFIAQLNTQKDLEDLYGIRMALEGFAVKRIIQTLSPEKLTILDETLEELKSITPDGLMDAVTKDLEFHEKICELSGNTKISELWKTSSLQMRTYLILDLQAYDDPTFLYSSHKIIVEAIKLKDESLAEKEICENIMRGFDNVKKRLISQQ